MKPRIRLSVLKGPRWHCTCDRFVGWGATPALAYADYLRTIASFARARTL